MKVSSELSAKMAALEEILAGCGRLALAFSGGADSAFLLKAAARALPPGRVLALTAAGPLFPAWETAEAAALAAELGVEQVVLETDPLAWPGVAENPPDRCYHCKGHLFRALIKAASDRGLRVVADGGNLDDLADYRPGTRAAEELGVISPLRLAGLTKAEVRALSRHLELPTWDKPACACLASRFPYGQRLTAEDLKMVERAEDYLRSLGLREVRVRCHGRLARLEVGRAERRLLFDEEKLDQAERRLKALGFSYAALDLGGYRPGSLNSEVTGGGLALKGK